MSTGRKITIVGLSILVAILIVGSGVLFVTSRGVSPVESATTATANGSRSETARPTDPDAESSTIDSTISASADMTSSGTSTGAASSGTESTSGVAASSPTDAGSGAAPAGGLVSGLLPGTMPTITVDLVGPEITSAQCGTPDRSIVVYLSDPSGIRSVSLSYSDGPVTTRTVKLTQFVGGSYWISSPAHTSPSPLTNLVVTATDNRGNTTVKALKILCTGV